MRQEVNLLLLNQCPIFTQLQIEEALLRADDRNWCLVNTGSTPTIVMGISGKRELLIHSETTLPIVRRFSGGGTVVVDESTCFVTTIFNHADAPVDPYPQPVLRWNAKPYESLLKSFHTVENDYALGDRKFAGNAQYFTKKRWIHHTSILWDYCPHRMQSLLFPPKTPQYRLKRSHEDFLCKLKDHLPSKEAFLEGILSHYHKDFSIHEVGMEEVESILLKEHRKSTLEIKKACIKGSE